MTNADTVLVCRTCKRSLPLERFYVRLDSVSGYTSECRECKRARSHRYFLDNQERHRETVKYRYETFGRFRRYGLAKNQYEAALIMQDDKCALCEAPEPGGKGVWHIDHRHVENRRNRFNQTDDSSTFRGLLCHNCNISLGHYEGLLQRVGPARIAEYLDGIRYELPDPVDDETDSVISQSVLDALVLDYEEIEV